MFTAENFTAILARAAQGEHETNMQRAAMREAAQLRAARVETIEATLRTVPGVVWCWRRREVHADTLDPDKTGSQSAYCHSEDHAHVYIAEGVNGDARRASDVIE